MKLHENQLKLLRHLARFNLLDYADCLDMLDTAKTGDRVALSYAFRPLTKNKYVSRRKDGSVSILAKGRSLFPEVKPLISVGGGTAGIKRVIEVSRMAALMEEHGIPSAGQIPDDAGLCFIPSACWRSIAPGILSTTRFTGMLLAYGARLAVYDIVDGSMEWQVRAESSLFYTRYGCYETKATGMLFVCRTDARDRVAERIIRQTMWQRRQLIRNRHYTERDRPVRWSRAPIRLRSQYERVYLTTPGRLGESIRDILAEPEQIAAQRGDGTPLNDPTQGDYESWPYRSFVCVATDLLKFVYFFSAARTLMSALENTEFPPPELRYAIYIRDEDKAILRMYPDILDMEGLKIYVYRLKEDAGGD